jgi:hypothetical protein
MDQTRHQLQAIPLINDERTAVSELNTVSDLTSAWKRNPAKWTAFNERLPRSDLNRRWDCNSPKWFACIQSINLLEVTIPCKNHFIQWCAFPKPISMDDFNRRRNVNSKKWCGFTKSRQPTFLANSGLSSIWDFQAIFSQFLSVTEWQTNRRKQRDEIPCNCHALASQWIKPRPNTRHSVRSEWNRVSMKWCPRVLERISVKPGTASIASCLISRSRFNVEKRM